MPHIDLRDILERTVSAVYGDLVTRPTGKAVRGGIERELESTDGDQVAVIDFSTVRCLDISCADEIVGQLLLTHDARYFVLHGVSDSHRDAIQQVLERHGLSVVAGDRSGCVDIIGSVNDEIRRVFATLAARGTAEADEIAEHLSVPPAAARQALEQLLARRLALQAAGRYVALTAR